MEKSVPVLQMMGIEKAFYLNQVLKGVDLSLYPGECVSLMGENGAGKSTLVKIICGVYDCDGGTITVDGQAVCIDNPDDAKKYGIRVIYQELSLFPSMTVAENIFINNELTATKKEGKLAPLRVKEMNRQAKAVLTDTLGIDIDVNKHVKDIPFSQRQMVEIARAVHSNARIIIMDEPTTALEKKEKETLFKIIDGLKKSGKTVVFISHHLDEIFRICDRAVVLRDGAVTMERPISELDEDTVIQAMIGKAVDSYYPKVELNPEGELQRVEGLTCGNTFKNISFDLKKREILGIVGLAGCGKYEIIRALFGIYPVEAGTVTLHGKTVALKKARDAIGNKFAFLPSERKVDGIFPGRDVKWNTTIATLDKVNGWKGLNLGLEKQITEQYVKDLNIKISSLTQPIYSLSGGNQQKVMLSRWFMSDPDVLLLEEPTRGIDVNAKTEVYRLVMDYVSQDKGAIFVSSEEEEVLGICDRIMVIHNGEIAALLNAKETSLETIKQYSLTAAKRRGEA